MIRDHAAAIKTLLQSASGLLVYDGEVPTGEGAPERYVVFYLTSPGQTRRRLTSASPKVSFLVSTLCVGSSPNECRWVAEKVHGALVGSRISVSGRVCDPFVSPLAPDQVRPDDSINPPAYVCTDAWPFNSSPI